MQAGTPRRGWLIVALLMSLAFALHFNRVSMSVAGTERLIGEQSLSETQMGLVYSSYLLVYTLFMVPGGWLIDRFGAKAALLVMATGSALLVTATGLTPRLVPAVPLLTALLVVRGLLGLVSVPTHPACANLVAQWMHVERRATANALVTAAALVGIASTYPGFGWLMSRFDWPRAFQICGLATLLLAALWGLLGSNRQAHASAAAVTQEALVSPPKSAGRPRCLLHSRVLVLVTLSYGAIGYFQYMHFYWMQYYFDQASGVGTEKSRLYTMVAVLAMAAGMLLGGWLHDRARIWFRGRLGRILTPAGGMAASALLLLVGVAASDPRWIVFWFSLSMAAAGMSEGPFWVTAVEVGGAQGGTSAAIFNMGGNLGGLFAPVLTPLISSRYGWPAALAVASALCLLGAAAWFWIAADPPRSGLAPGFTPDRD